MKIFCIFFCTLENPPSEKKKSGDVTLRSFSYLLNSRLYAAALTLPGLKAQLASVAVDDNAVTVLDRAADDFARQLGFYAAAGTS